jgi:hypothetical protein
VCGNAAPVSVNVRADRAVLNDRRSRSIPWQFLLCARTRYSFPTAQFIDNATRASLRTLLFVPLLYSESEIIAGERDWVSIYFHIGAWLFLSRWRRTVAYQLGEKLATLHTDGDDECFIFLLYGGQMQLGWKVIDSALG